MNIVGGNDGSGQGWSGAATAGAVRAADAADVDAPDAVDHMRAQWARELPEVDTQGMAILGRARRLTLAARGLIEAAFAAQELDTGTFDVLSTLLRAGPPYRLRPTELYRGLMISSGGLTDRLARLAKAGLIARPPAPDDGRSLLVELTAAGRARIESAFRHDMDVEAAMLQALAPGERDQLAGLLRKLLRAVELDAGASHPEGGQ